MVIAYLPDLLTDVARPAVLELGGRRVTPDPWNPPSHWKRVGVDVHPGDGVDVVADAHDLSNLRAGSFDAFYSHAVFEHLAMPWKAALELNRVLTEGALGWVVTHEAFPVHEWPWDFWRFGPGCLSSLFAATGFEVLGERPLEPCRVQPPGGAPSYAGHTGCEVQVRKVGPPAADLRWNALPGDLLPRGHTYPTGLARQGRRAQRVAVRVGRRLGVAATGRASAPDPWRLLKDPSAWLVVAGPDAREFAGCERLELAAGGLAATLRDVPDAALSHLLLADALSRDAAPWAALESVARVLAPGGRLLVDDVQVAPAERPGWRLTSEALLMLLHGGAGFRLERRRMLDPCVIEGGGCSAATVERAYGRVLGLARRVGDWDSGRFSWPS